MEKLIFQYDLVIQTIGILNYSSQRQHMLLSPSFHCNSPIILKISNVLNVYRKHEVSNNCTRAFHSSHKATDTTKGMGPQA